MLYDAWRLLTSADRSNRPSAVMLDHLGERCFKQGWSNAKKSHGSHSAAQKASEKQTSSTQHDEAQELLAQAWVRLNYVDGKTTGESIIRTGNEIFEKVFFEGSRLSAYRAFYSRCREKGWLMPFAKDFIDV